MAHGLAKNKQTNKKTVEIMKDKEKLRYVYNHSLEDTPEKAMAPHSSILAWKIPWVEEPDRLQSMGLLGVRHD